MRLPVLHFGSFTDFIPRQLKLISFFRDELWRMARLQLATLQQFTLIVPFFSLKLQVSLTASFEGYCVDHVSWRKQCLEVLDYLGICLSPNLFFIHCTCHAVSPNPTCYPRSLKHLYPAVAPACLFTPKSAAGTAWVRSAGLFSSWSSLLFLTFCYLRFKGTEWQEAQSVH